jgi:hypothetical protein
MRGTAARPVHRAGGDAGRCAESRRVGLSGAALRADSAKMAKQPCQWGQDATGSREDSVPAKARPAVGRRRFHRWRGPHGGPGSLRRPGLHRPRCRRRRVRAPDSRLCRTLPLRDPRGRDAPPPRPPASGRLRRLGRGRLQRRLRGGVALRLVRPVHRDLHAQSPAVHRPRVRGHRVVGGGACAPPSPAGRRSARGEPAGRRGLCAVLPVRLALYCARGTGRRFGHGGPRAGRDAPTRRG